MFIQEHLRTHSVRQQRGGRDTYRWSELFHTRADSTTSCHELVRGPLHVCAEYEYMNNLRNQKNTHTDTQHTDVYALLFSRWA